MQKLLANWPTLLTLFVTVGAWLAVHFGWLTPLEVSSAAVALGPVWAKFLHDMAPTKPPTDPSPAALIFFVAMLLPACGGHFEEARGPRSIAIGAPAPALVARCISLDDREAFYGGTAKGTAALAGASGLATVPMSDDRAKFALGVSSAVLAAIAVTTGFIAESSATSYVSEGCAK